MGKYALSSPFLPPEEQGRRLGSPAAANLAVQDQGGGREWGGKGKGGSRIRFPPSILGKEARRAGIHGGGGQ